MINYKDYEKEVYNWLIGKRKQDPNFTFSIRDKEKEGSELSYFMGGEQSRYFTFRLWSIPSVLNSSPGNCIGVVFKYSANYLKYDYDFKLISSNAPRDKQSTSVLNLIKSLAEPLDKSIGLSSKGNLEIKNFEIRTTPQKKGYTDLNDMLQDIDEDLAKFIPLVSEHIEIEKQKNPEFEAHRISLEEFESMQEKLQTRFEKYGGLIHQSKEVMNVKNEFIVWLLNKPKSNYFNNDKEKLSRYLDTYNTYFDLDIFEVSKLNYKDIIEAIDEVAYKNEQSEFFKYSDRESTHRPRAILGKTNYYQFLKEKFDSKMLKSGNKQALLKISNLLEKYKNALLNDNWLYVELYKFEWANWLTERVNFDKQTDGEILELCLASQNENYTDARGVQFIKQGAREKLSKYIGIEDIKIFRDFYNGIALENIDYSARNMSFPILSCWMSVLVPNSIFPASRTSFADIIKEVFSIKLKQSKIDFVIAMQKPMQTICNVLLEDEKITEFISKELHKSELSQLDLNWLTQDFLLYVDRHPSLLKPITETVEEELEQYIMLDKVPTNQILYGPPGTGKTYNTINKAIAIANPEFDLTQDRILVKEEYARLVKNGQVVFTTFHQSMSYEDFVEGIKPKTTEDKKVTYEIEDGIFKQLADKAKGLKGKITSENNTTDFKNKNYFKMSIGGKNRKDVHDWCIENNYISLGWGNEENYTEYNNIKNWDTYRNKFKNEFSYLVEDSKYHIQAMFIFQKMNIGDIVLISLGNHCIDAIGIITGEYEYIEDSNIPYRHFRKVKWLATNLDANPSLFVDKNISQQSIYQFNNEDIKVDYLEQTFSKSKEEVITPKNHVLIIDEINRGNVSAIFGELITLLESDKRLGQDEAISVELPYSKTVFGIPANLHIIGTMNTADRSVEALDTALRRRFEFKEMMPDYTVIENEEVDNIKLSEVLKKINERIELLIDRDHAIGHSYFFNVNSEEKLAKA
ncbi:MAG: AAA family ATPase, partial [Polaribacter sp.]|uniref:AAA family ATPase n=1 Tax=Polaribacter sp. TaxID=1920175 RepID=UPI003EF3FC12